MACVAGTLSVYNQIMQARRFMVPITWVNVVADWNTYRPLYEGRIESVVMECDPWITVRVSGKYHLFSRYDLHQVDPDKLKELMEFNN